jgi:antitoxin component of MazEF toxin-antitoxin module
LEHKK